MAAKYVIDLLKGGEIYVKYDLLNPVVCIGTTNNAQIRMPPHLKGDTMKRTPQFEEVNFQPDWELLEKKHRIVIEANKASVSRRRLLGDIPLFTATAILGTKVADIKMNSQSGVPGPIFDLDHDETFTESNVASELKPLCLFILADWDLAQKVVNAE
jgi:hypothetical protein